MIYKYFEINDGTTNVVRRRVYIELRRYNIGRGHITLTMESGWGNDKPEFVGRTSNKKAVKELVKKYLSHADVQNYYEFAKSLGF